MSKMRENTRLARGSGPDPVTGSLSVPIYRSATYHHPEISYDPDKYYYSRCDTPTRRAFEKELAYLEHGEDAVATTSGMSAIALVLKLFGPGDHVIVTSDLYGGSYRLLTNLYARYGIEFQFINTWNLEDVKKSIKPNTKGFLIETPSNPAMHVTDIESISRLVREINIERGIETGKRESGSADAHPDINAVLESKRAYLIVDNTLLSPYFQKPLTHGADIVVHSATKYIAGHNDVLAGAVVVKKKAIREFFYFFAMSEGGVLSADDSWLALRGLQTLSVRLDREQENAFEVVKFLKQNPAVEKVIYAGDPEHPDYELSKKQTTGFGALVSFYVKEPEKIPEILERLRVINVAGSLGGTQSLITYPSSGIQLPIPEEQRLETGVTDKLLRISIGIEDVRDLIDDLDQALSIYGSNINADKKVS